jgi:N-acetylneuraminic acid mutarotase
METDLENNTIILSKENNVEELYEWITIFPGGIVPTGRHCNSCVEYKGSIYIFGGYSDDGMKRSNPRNDFFRYNILENQWTLVNTNSSPPSSRHSHTAVIYKNKMVIFGGVSEQTRLLNDLHYFDFDSQEWKEITEIKGDIPPPRWGHTSIMKDSNTMVIFGGYGLTFYNDIYSFNFDTSTWNRIRGYGAIPKPRQYHTAIFYNKNMYIFGGFSFYNFQEFYQFNFENHVWCQCNPPPDGRRGHSAVIFQNEMFIFGGFSSCQTNTLIKYNFGIFIIYDYLYNNVRNTGME